jgi:hypothetical protein
MKRKLFTQVVVIILLLGGILPQGRPVLAAQVNKLEATSANAFGYVLQTGVFNSQWIGKDPTWTEVSFDAPDDSIAHVADLGFSFPFFENSYSDVYISTNGFLAFNLMGDDNSPTNYPIPSENPPNNLIAAFWDDLVVGSSGTDGAVYYQVYGTASNHFAVFEWYDVNRLGKPDLMKFEIILHENGDIELVYDTLGGILSEMTAGIEDADGVDGSLLVYNAPYLASARAYKYVYPTGTTRVKAKPLYQGKFLEGGKVDLPFTVVNTGKNPDTFHFQTSILAGDSSWPVQVRDSRGNPVTNTPSLAPNASFSAFIHVTSSTSAVSGSYVNGQITVISNHDAAKSFSIRFDAAIPAPFTVFYVDSAVGYVKYITPRLQATNTTFPIFTGSSFSITRISTTKYLASWENILKGTPINFENIQKTIKSPFTPIQSPTQNLVDNSGEPVGTYDSSPVTAVAPNGKTGVVYVHQIANEAGKRNTNIYFARLDTSGNLLPSPLKLTNNEDYLSNPTYSMPAIIATSNSSYVIVYQVFTPHTGNNAQDIGLTVVDADGVVTTPTQLITDSFGTGIRYYSPSIALLNNGTVFLSYLSIQTTETTNKVTYTILDPANGSTGAPTVISGAEGDGLQACNLSGGAVLIAWVSSSFNGVGYSVFNSSGTPITPTFGMLPSPNGWEINYISLTGEINGKGIITWMDGWGKFMYYALISPGGSQVTPPMAFLRSANLITPGILSSSTGQGVAPLVNEMPWNSYLPTTRRQ